MQKAEIIAIATNVSEGTATEEEMVLYINHIDSFVKEYPDWENLNAETKQNIEAQLRADIWAELHGSGIKSKTMKLWPRIATIAAVLAVIVSGLYFFNYRNDKHRVARIVYANDVAPGKNSATLTLANGKKISLTDAINGQVAEESGIVITKTGDGKVEYTGPAVAAKVGQMQFNLLSTARGESYQIVLPDGSSVWLNAGSTLKYPIAFTGGSRNVELKGEAYFEIKKDKAHPFIVKSEKQTVTVLGTHFNINAYDDESLTKTTLLEGSVLVSSFQSGKGSKTLKPGQQSIIDDNSIAVTDADTESAIAWKNGEFMFNNEELGSIMKKVERWYNVEVEYRDKDIAKEPFWGTISRFGNVSDVLNILELTKKVHFKVNGRRIIVNR